MGQEDNSAKMVDVTDVDPVTTAKSPRKRTRVMEPEDRVRERSGKASAAREDSSSGEEADPEPEPDVEVVDVEGGSRKKSKTAAKPKGPGRYQRMVDEIGPMVMVLDGNETVEQREQFWKSVALKALDKEINALHTEPKTHNDVSRWTQLTECLTQLNWTKPATMSKIAFFVKMLTSRGVPNFEEDMKMPVAGAAPASATQE